MSQSSTLFGVCVAYITRNINLIHRDQLKALPLEICAELLLDILSKGMLDWDSANLFLDCGHVEIVNYIKRLDLLSAYPKPNIRILIIQFFF
jgi:hypothetical protein